MKKYFNPYTDFGFKKLFGEEANKHLLIDFLNAVLNVEHKIADITFKNREKLGATIFDRHVVLDIYCTDERGSHFFVEMQKAKHENFKDRVLFYSSHLIIEQAKKGKWDFELTPIYCISILDFNLDDNIKGKVIQEIKLREANGEVFYDKLTLIFIQMTNFNLGIDQLETQLHKWLYFLKYLENFEEIPIIFGDKIFKSAFEVAALSKLDPEEMKEYEFSLKKIQSIEGIRNAYMKDGEKIGLEKGIQIGMKKGLRQGILQGIQQGIEKGREEGIEEGIEKGIAKGREEGIEKGLKEGLVIMAERLLREGFTVEEVAKLTQLPLKVVLEINLKTKKE